MPRPVLTITLIVLSIAATLAATLEREATLTLLLIDTHVGGALFSDVLRGQAWRLVTPIFLHFGVLHILFNMMWLWDMGRAIEALRGPAFLGTFIAVTGIASNLAQYVISRSPVFGGMSGVVYALLGYIWMQGRFNPRFGIALHKSTVIMMIAWFVLCWTGLVGPIANWAHTAGLVIGAAWGFVDRRPSRLLPAGVNPASE